MAAARLQLVIIIIIIIINNRRFIRRTLSTSKAESEAPAVASWVRMVTKSLFKQTGEF